MTVCQQLTPKFNSDVVSEFVEVLCAPFCSLGNLC